MEETTISPIPWPWSGILLDALTVRAQASDGSMSEDEDDEAIINRLVELIDSGGTEASGIAISEAAFKDTFKKMTDQPYNSPEAGRF